MDNKPSYRLALLEIKKNFHMTTEIGRVPKMCPFKTHSTANEAPATHDEFHSRRPWPRHSACVSALPGVSPKTCRARRNKNRGCIDKPDSRIRGPVKEVIFSLADEFNGIPTDRVLRQSVDRLSNPLSSRRRRSPVLVSVFLSPSAGHRLNSRITSTAH